MATITAADKVIDKFQDVADRADDLRRFYNTVMPKFWEARQKAVVESGRLPALSPASQRRKKVHKQTALLQTGALLEATYLYAPVVSRPDSATFGIPKGNKSRGLGAMHAVASGTRPRRDIVPNWGAKERRQILDMLAEYLMENT